MREKYRNSKSRSSVSHDRKSKIKIKENSDDHAQKNADPKLEVFVEMSNNSSD